MRPVLPNQRSLRHIESERFDPSLRQLAHELNSMLDGAMRYINIAQKMLEQGGDGPSAEQAISRLTAAQQGLSTMASMLQRTLRGDGPLDDDPQPLGQHVREIIATCAPYAEQHDVHVQLHISKAAEALPTGPMGPVVLNGLRNAIEACAAAGGRCGQVEISIGINHRDELEVIIADTGVGLAASPAAGKDQSHAIGLDLCRHLAERIGGSLELMNVPFGGGAVLRVVIPVDQLQRHE